ncbi:MAG TPA: TIGR03854 family LLM class F420-dependent oxidoreductase [Streptosporangiaceae bacterium]
MPAPRPRKRDTQQQLELAELTEDQIEKNDFVNSIRDRVGRWRQAGYPDVTPVTRRLLECWSDPDRDNPVLFCQREAAETAIYLAEAAQKAGDVWIRNELGRKNQAHNTGLNRVGLKMATGSGKTVVMTMLIAWQTLNKAAAPNDARFANRFLVVTPGLTIRDRPRVLRPGEPDSYYKLRDLVPSDLEPGIAAGADRDHQLSTHCSFARPRPTRASGGDSLTAALRDPDVQIRPLAWSDGVVKIRIGVGLGQAGHPDTLASTVEQLEAARVDSLWFSEVVTGPMVEPFTGLAYAAARTSRLKVGTGVSVLPGRHPVLVAKQLATLFGLAPGRILPVFGLQPARRGERDFFPLPARRPGTGDQDQPVRRGAVFDESLRLLRLLLTQESVSFDGEFFSVSDARPGPVPGKPLDIWLGGSAPGALDRVGRLGDGWLASFRTPLEARAGREAIQQAAADAGREVDPEHFGISLAVATGGTLPAETVAAVRQRRPQTDPAELIALGWDDARQMIERYVEAGISKFVVRPAEASVPLPGEFLDHLVSDLMPLQT